MNKEDQVTTGKDIDKASISSRTRTQVLLPTVPACCALATVAVVCLWILDMTLARTLIGTAFALLLFLVSDFHGGTAVVVAGARFLAVALRE